LSHLHNQLKMCCELWRSLQKENLIGSSMQSSLEAVTDQPSKPPRERVKIVISVQDKDGLKHFRMYMVYLCAGILDLFTAEKMGLEENGYSDKWVLEQLFMAVKVVAFKINKK
jgi:hypothetical protein